MSKVQGCSARILMKDSSMQPFIAQHAAFRHHDTMGIGGNTGKFVSQSFTRCSRCCEYVAHLCRCAGMEFFQCVPDSLRNMCQAYCTLPRQRFVCMGLSAYFVPASNALTTVLSYPLPVLYQVQAFLAPSIKPKYCSSRNVGLYRKLRPADGPPRSLRGRSHYDAYGIIYIKILVIFVI